MARLPAGCSVEWIKQPERQDRLLDWLQKHAWERQSFFNAKVGRALGLSKTQCVNMAAQAIFSHDENPANSVAVKKDPEPFGNAITSLVRVTWCPKYQKVNEAIGRTAARLPYADFDPNSDAKKIADAEMIKFPQWARLHNFWRLLPEFNQFADKGVESSPQTTGRKRKKARDVEDSDEPEDSDESYSSRKPVEQPQARVKIGPPGRRAKRIKRSSTLSMPSHKAKTEKDKSIVIDLEEDEPSEHSRASTSTTAFLTRDQRHEKEMAELRLRTIEQERKAKEQEYKALEEKRKHEAFMAVYGAPKL